jgi:4-carboxymuconolactone decarboxylase
MRKPTYKGMNRARKLLALMKKRRGYILPIHQIMAEFDPAFLESYETFLNATFLTPRSLDRKTKELILVSVLTAIAAPPYHVRTHISAAIAAGASERQVLEALQLVMPAVGAARFMEGINSWLEATQAPTAGQGTPSKMPQEFR